MLTQLDQEIAHVMGALTAPGGMLQTAPLSRFGRELPMIAAAPPSLPGYFAYFCAQHGAREFIVDGDIRLTFAETYAAARVAAA
jgi:long-chain acyl-CoA synthetase